MGIAFYAGIDDEDWNPQTDRHIAANYTATNFAKGKAKNKAALQKELGLPERPDVPLIGFIGRLDYQKGADLVLAAAPWLISQDVQLVCLGTGDSGLEVCRPTGVLLQWFRRSCTLMHLPVSSSCSQSVMLP